jgi:hypothetical protein
LPCTGTAEEVTPLSTSGAGEWDLVVPDDGAELLAEFRRHGVRPGQRLHLRAVPDADESRDADRDEFWDAFIGSAGPGGDPDLSANAKDILGTEMGT